MMPAAKHGDPQLGVDIHLCVVPPSPAPVPLPTPHMSIVFDPMDYIPFFGATVTVCGMKRATAGSNAKVIHIPPGFPFAPKLPDTEDEIFMGSATVDADGDPFSFLGVPVLGCQVAGMFSPPRIKKKGKKLMLLPTTFNLAIPTNVFIGGPPTISLMGMASKLGFAALGKFAKSKFFKRMRKKLFGHMKPGFLKCMILRAEPVNILTGEVSVEQEDFTLPGHLPMQWVRTYTSGNRRVGLCGHGWECPADGRLEISHEGVLMQYPGVGPLYFNCLPAAQGDENAELELMDGALLSDHGNEFRVTTKADHIYFFPKELVTTKPGGNLEIALWRISDFFNNWIEFARYGDSSISIHESAGRIINISLENTLIKEISLNLFSTNTKHTFVKYEHDREANLIVVRDSLNKPYVFEYESHHMVRHTNRNTLSFYYTFDKASVGVWRVKRAWGDGGLYNYKFEYLDELRERRITDSLGHVSLVKLNEYDLPISEIDPLGEITLFKYDDVGRTTEIISPSGLCTNFKYDERGNLLELKQPDDSVIVCAYSVDNKIVTFTDPLGGLWQQQWDERGLLKLQKTPLETATSYHYNQNGQLVKHINPRGAATEFTFNSYNQVSSITNALGHQTHFNYDDLGRLLHLTDHIGRNTSYVYDSNGRLIKSTLPSGVSVTCDYDSEDQLVCFTDESGGQTKLEYFGIGQVARRLQPDGHSISYTYDTEEQLVGLVNQRGETYHIKRDPLGRIIEEIDYWGQTRRYEYDAVGRLLRSIDQLGRVLSYKTDKVGRITHKTLADFSHPNQQITELFKYNNAGQLIEAHNPVSKVVRIFDAAGRLTSETQNDFKIENEYDEIGNRTQRKTSANNTMRIEYDLLDQPAKISINEEAPIIIERNAQGQVTLEQLSPQIKRTHKYNDDGLHTALAVLRDGKPLFDTRFDYDSNGNLTQRSDSEYGIDQYTYDPMGCILQHTDPLGNVTKYLNDPAGDRLSTRIREVEMRQAVGEQQRSNIWSREGEYEGQNYVFDRAGNLTSRHHYTEPGKPILHLVWDSNQRLMKSQWENGDRHNQITSYGYDPLGRRIFKRNVHDTTWFFWDGDALLGEMTQANEPTANGAHEKVVSIMASKNSNQSKAYLFLGAREYVYWPATFEPLALIDKNNKFTNNLQNNQILGSAEIEEQSPLIGSLYLYHNDMNGCPTRLSTTNGQIVWGANYTAWGGANKTGVNEIEQPLRMLGQQYDDESGLHYNRNRYYDALAGQFIGQDPIGLHGGLNPYQYGYNVLRWVDPTGLKGCQLEKVDDLTHDYVLKISKKEYPETAEHIADAIKSGRADIVEIARDGAKDNRKASLFGIPTKAGFDRDEWPMAMFKEGGNGASIRYINPSDNRGAGSSIGSALSKLDDGTLIKIVIVP
jgi:RHS repeat-associated protein